MADKKISALTNASTPLAGTEVLPIVQSGTTVKVSAANVTAGRAVSGASFAVTGGTAPANGFYLQAADTVGISTASTARGVVSATGNFGLGTTTPQYRVDVQDQSAANNFQASFGGTFGVGTWTGIHIGYKEANNTLYRKGAVAFEMVDGDARGTVHILNNGAASAASATLADSKLRIAFGGDVTVPAGNLVLGTAGRGIDFSANGGDILTQYDEGTWAISDISGAGLTLTVDHAKYTRVGNLVTVNVYVTYPVTANASNATLSLPSNLAASKFDIGTAGASNGNAAYAITVGGTNAMTLRGPNLATLTNANLSGADLLISFTYMV